MPGTIDGRSPAAKCDRGVAETVQNVILECKKYDRERTSMMQMFLGEVGREENGRTGREWMVLL